MSPTFPKHSGFDTCTMSIPLLWNNPKICKDHWDPFFHFSDPGSIIGPGSKGEKVHRLKSYPNPTLQATEYRTPKYWVLPDMSGKSFKYTQKRMGTKMN